MESVTFLLEGEAPKKRESGSETAEKARFTEDQVQGVLSDLRAINFTDNTSFENLASCYRDQGRSSLFDYVLLNRLRDIANLLDEKCDLVNQEEFRKKLGLYLLESGSSEEIKMFEEKLLKGLEYQEVDIKQVLSDFEKLNFNLAENKCEDSADLVNYNNGWPADPFDKIANYYRFNKNIFLFNFVVLNKREEILGIVNAKLTEYEGKRNNFKARLARYLLRIYEGMTWGQELVKGNSASFVDGRYVPCTFAKRPVNHFECLRINAEASGESLDTRRLFTEKTARMEKNGGGVDQVNIYGNNGTLLNIVKDQENRRNYQFGKGIQCKFQIGWTAKEGLDCVMTLKVGAGGTTMEKSTVNGEAVEWKEMKELAKLNTAVLVDGKALSE